MRQKYILISLFLLNISFLFAQNTYTLQNNETQYVEKFEILADKN